MKLEAEDRSRSNGPTERWRTWSRDTREPSPLTMALTLDTSVLSLTLKRTMCSMAWVDILIEVL